MASDGLRVVSHIGDVNKAMNNALMRALEMVGGMAETEAKEKCPTDTGNLRNSITHKVLPAEKAVIIGSNVEYAPYVELGTGIYYAGGRQTPWLYEDSKGNTHITKGSPAKPFLKPAVEEHRSEYKQIIKNELKG